MSESNFYRAGQQANKNKKYTDEIKIPCLNKQGI
jgi:hypothetical protein